LTTISFGIFLIVIGLIITGAGSIWLVTRRIRRGRERTQRELSSGVRWR
jgi:hypothetical protein